MDKRYQVFVSSTYEDLQDERREVMQALLELDCIPAGMELFPASNDDQWSLIKRVIDDCDYYILIVGGRYGSTNEDGKSYTQMEFEYALSTGKPIISFLHKHPENIPNGKTEQSAEGKEKLEAFKYLAKKKLIKYWETPVELGSVISRSMIKLIKEFPAEGWIKANSAADAEAEKEIALLQKENRQLKEKIEKISNQPPLGIENLAQGHDSYTVDYVYETTLSSDRISSCSTFTWDELFGMMGPHFLNGYPESELKVQLENLISNRLYSIMGYGLKIDCLFVDQECFQTLLLQFRALGLIKLSDKKDYEMRVWELTNYGDSYLLQMVAIRKPHSKDDTP